MNKKLFVLLTIVIILMMPSMTYAQTEPIQFEEINKPNIDSNILIQMFGAVLFIGWSACLICGFLKPSKRRRKTYKPAWKPKSVKDPIETESVLELAKGQKLIKGAYYWKPLDDEPRNQKASPAEVLAYQMQTEMKQQIALIEAQYTDFELGLPQPEAIMLPDLSNEEDGYDWRTCPYCGEWNSGKATRCVNCDGRLGRPLG